MSDAEDHGKRNRRLVVVVAVLVLAVLGAGIGSFALDGDDGLPGETTPTPEGTANVSLSLPGEATLLNVSGVTPGERGTRRLTLTNDGPDAGRLRVAGVSVFESENGVTGPESAVDDSPDAGELGEYFLVAVSLVGSDGRTPLYGTGDGARPLGAVAGEGASTGVVLDSNEQATVVLSWRLPADTGNVVQSDSLRLNATFQIEGRESG